MLQALHKSQVDISLTQTIDYQNDVNKVTQMSIEPQYFGFKCDTRTDVNLEGILDHVI